MGDDGGAPECRICRLTEEDSESKLYLPCRCSGSIAYVHEECLEQWISMKSGGSRCEICKYDFQFEPLYREGTPEILSCIQLAQATAAWALNKLPGCA